jgi:carbon starvation protein
MMSAMPVLVAVLCLMAIAYRYYSAFLAAKVLALDDSRETPAYQLRDGQNYHPTGKWVLFGHHFAAISGAGPLIGPVLAAQFGYLPGLLWIVIGVCIGGAVQDFLVLVASTRRNGKSLAQIAFHDVGPTAGWAATVAILFIIVIALAGLGKVVVKALGGEAVGFPPDSRLVFHEGAPASSANGVYTVPTGTEMTWNAGRSTMRFSGAFDLKLGDTSVASVAAFTGSGTIPAKSVRLVPGSSWGTFTIACTIPIALFVGIYMYRLRKGRVVEASLIGAALTLGATVLGGWVAQHEIGRHFDLTAHQVTIAMAAYGFIASVLPVWVLLCPRDYLSSFLKIGTIILLVVGVLVANPTLQAPAYNAVFAGGGPVVAGNIFPFLFITVMCGAISGFHALVSSGTTPKMLARESHARTIGYGAMMVEGIVAVVAMIAAASLPTGDYYAMNTDLANIPVWNERILAVGGSGGLEHLGQATSSAADNVAQYERLTHESLRGRVGGAVTLAVGMAHIFDRAAMRFASGNRELLDAVWRYWYHFAIMFEALFILTTIDTGTRVGRFLLQEVLGRAHPAMGLHGKWPSAVLSTATIVIAWAWFMNSGSFSTIWALFGIANQMLAVIALAIVTVFLANSGKTRFLWVTLIPMAVVMAITTTAALQMLSGQIDGVRTQLGNSLETRNMTLLTNSVIQAVLTISMLSCALIVIGAGARRVWLVSVRPSSSATASTVPEPIAVR